MYEAIYAAPVGESTVARMAATAAAYGFDGVIVRDRPDDPADYKPERIRERFGIDVVDGIEIDVTDPSRASGYVGNYRPKTTIVCVRGGSPAMNRFAVHQAQVDVLTGPLAGTGGIDDALAKAAADNGVRIEIDLTPILRGSGGSRVEAIRLRRTLVTLLDHYDVPFVASAAPTAHLQLRAPRELAAVGDAIGLESVSIEDGLAEWGRLAARNRDRRSESFIGPGIKRGRHEEVDR
ncbi:MAG: RNase P subunit p30 family protein [Halobacteriales archaeon]